MIEQVKQKSKFSFEEYRSMLNLQCGIDQSLGDRASGGSDYNIYLMELHALAIDEMDEGAGS